jgi:hypothetical protein
MTAASNPLMREAGDPGWQELPAWADGVADDGCGPGARDEDRRNKQREENIAIGEGSDTVPIAQIHTVPEMLKKFVFIKDGSQVAPIDRPQAVLNLADFRNSMAASKHWLEVDGRKKAVPATKAWLESPERMEAESLTFHAGAPRMTTEPGTGRNALNSWAGFDRPGPPTDWMVRSKPFVDHVEWLWGADAPRFLNWLAHIEQKPGELPHYGWVHISRQHGKGRNWIASVLTRVWKGHTAASVDLIPLLEGSFNGNLSRKVFAYVDEINEGGSASYKHAQKLRQLVTEEQRDINPKYGRQRVEYNSCRWLIYSNHTGALPLTEEDRRFHVVAHDGPPRDVAYYSKLYGLLGNPQFVAAVAEFLRQRDLRHFKPGAPPPMTQAKAELIGFSQSEDDVNAKAVAAHWPVDVILAKEIAEVFGDGGTARAPVRHALDRAGIRKLPKKVRYFEHGVQHVYAVRNFERWATAIPDAIKNEANRVAPHVKIDSLEPEE